ncbi:hypothetical protein M413DRAFT_423131 [Hebeloma cylindrosporum]|uniref:Uncharacterized protein n=1 Tax=Hebeloma cylindrosporum TaxID=76867 RepID=A0A0C3CTZ2_HEBCY|nr:hypothetical protein M413DRAFT_423131 [Hebeloma cylindrosporum h7]
MVLSDSASYSSSQSAKCSWEVTLGSPARSPRKPHPNNFRHKFRVALGWTAPEYENEFKDIKRFLRSLGEKHFELERTGTQQEQEAKIKVRNAIVEKYRHIFDGSRNAKKLQQAMSFVKSEHSARRGDWKRNNKERQRQRRKILAKETEVPEYISLEDSESSLDDLLDDEAQLRIPAPSSSKSINYANNQRPFIPEAHATKSSPKQKRTIERLTPLVTQRPIVVTENRHPVIQTGRDKSPQKGRRIVDFWERRSTPMVSQRPIVVDTPDVGTPRPSTLSEARAPEREKSPEAPRLSLKEFLQTCTPTMEVWYSPLVAFGCDNIPFLEALARWDDKSLKAALRRVKDQPGIDKKLKETDAVFLFRNLRKRLQTRAVMA